MCRADAYNRTVQAVPLLLVAAGGLVSAAIAWGLAAGRIPAPMAHPEARSLHARAVPRAGGLAIWAGVAAALAGLGFPPLGVSIPMLLVIAVSLIDDYRGLAPRIRILVHGIAAIVVAGAWLGGDPLLLVLEVLAIVWMANLYNFMDGADGLAGSMGVCGFAALAIGAFQSSQAGSAWTLVAIAAACAGFLPFNRPTARLFMGDVGAVGLGFAAGAFGLRGWLDGAWPWWFPPLVFMPFVFDATFTLISRMIRRQPLALSHRDHFYQRAILRAGRHGPTVAGYAGWMIAAAVAALAALRWAPELGAPALIGLTAGFALYCHSITRSSPSAPDARNAG